MKKNKIILAMLISTLCGCSIVQPEPEIKDNPIEKIEKPHEVIVGFGDEGLGIPFALREQNETGAWDTNPSILSGSYYCFISPSASEIIDGKKVFVSSEGKSKYVESSIKKYGDIFEPELSGSIYINATIDIAIYCNRLLDLCYYLLDINTGLVTCKTLGTQVIQPELTGSSISIDETYNDPKDSETNPFEKHSHLNITYNYIFNLDKSFTIYEYNENDEIIKSSKGQFDWDEYTLDENTEYYIIETISDIYKKDYTGIEKSSISETDVKTKKLYNKRDKNVSVDFYHDPGMNYINKTTLKIIEPEKH